MAILTYEKFCSDHFKRLGPLYEASGAENWLISYDEFTRAVWEGFGPAAVANPDRVPELLKNVRADELVLAMACVKGNERAWEAFSFGYRTVIYEAACAIASDLSLAREISDSLAAELYGLDAETPGRKSRLAYFHGRSSLKTWLRALVYQKFVDEYRRTRRLEPLPEKEELPSTGTGSVSAQDDQRYSDLLSEALNITLRELTPAEKMLLGFYYVQQLTLKQIGRLRGEHEATVSRNLEALRKKIRKRLEAYLRRTKKLPAYDVDRCFDFAARGVSIDLDQALKTDNVPQEGAG
ncbi:MAG: RNA polymerase sigma factor [Terriglobia bacterium]